MLSPDGDRCVRCSAGENAAPGWDHCGTCPPGSSPDPTTGGCLCDAGTVFASLAPFAWEEIWKGGELRHEPSGSCLPCPPGARCEEKDARASTSSLRLEDAHWRPTLSSLDARPCPTPELCRGAEGAGDAQCARDSDRNEAALGAANTGPMCQLCAEGGYPQANGVCVACATSGVRVALTGGAGLLLLASIVAWFGVQMWRRRKPEEGLSLLPAARAKMGKARSTAQAQEAIDEVRAKLESLAKDVVAGKVSIEARRKFQRYVAKLKIALAFYQIVCEYANVFEIR